jgi:hypothetical protein
VVPFQQLFVARILASSLAPKRTRTSLEAVLSPSLVASFHLVGNVQVAPILSARDSPPWGSSLPTGSLDSASLPGLLGVARLHALSDGVVASLFPAAEAGAFFSARLSTSSLALDPAPLPGLLGVTCLHALGDGIVARRGSPRAPMGLRPGGARAPLHVLAHLFHSGGTRIALGLLVPLVASGLVAGIAAILKPVLIPILTGVLVATLIQIPVKLLIPAIFPRPRLAFPAGSFLASIASQHPLRNGIRSGAGAGHGE